MNKNDFAKVPPRGWNSYDYYDTTVTEDDVKANADYMAAKLLKYGYEYVVVDIQWYAYDTGSQREKYQYIPFGRCEMDMYGRLLPCPDKFPSSKNGAGFKPLADYVHSKGLKFGIHMMRGIPRAAAHRHLPVKCSGMDNEHGAVKGDINIKGCGNISEKYSPVTADMIADPVSICDWNPDMYGLRDCPESQAYYDSLLELYASWGVDFIKCDDICNTHAYKEKPYMGRHEVEMLYHAVKKCGRDIVLSLSPGPALIEQAAHYCMYANMWRISDDFWDNWTLLKNMFDYCEKWQYVVSEGCWPDCDMLPVGKIGGGFLDERETNFTKAEQQTMFALWCMFKSPLMIGAKLTCLDEWTLGLLTNSELLKLQGSAYRSRQVVKTESYAVWVTDALESKEVAAALFNFEDEDAVIETGTEEWHRVSRIRVENKAAVFEELFSGETVGMRDGRCRVKVKGHGAAVIKMK